MVNIVIEVSKYLMILLIAAYTYWNFSYFRFRDPWQQGKVCVRQNVAMFLLHFVAYAVLFLKSEDERDYPVLCGPGHIPGRVSGTL